MDVSLLSSSRPASADEPHRTLFSIVAENLSLAASTAGDPSSCATLICQLASDTCSHVDIVIIAFQGAERNGIAWSKTTVESGAKN